MQRTATPPNQRLGIGLVGRVQVVRKPKALGFEGGACSTRTSAADGSMHTYVSHALSTSSAASLASAFAGALAAGARAPGSRNVPAPATEGHEVSGELACWVGVSLPARAALLTRKRSAGSSCAVALQARNHCSDTTLQPVCAGVSCSPLHRRRKHGESRDTWSSSRRTSGQRRQQQSRAWQCWRRRRRCRCPSRGFLATRDTVQRCGRSRVSFRRLMLCAANAPRVAEAQQKHPAARQIQGVRNAGCAQQRICSGASCLVRGRCPAVAQGSAQKQGEL